MSLIAQIALWVWAVVAIGLFCVNIYLARKSITPWVDFWFGTVISIGWPISALGVIALVRDMNNLGVVHEREA